MDVVLWWEVEEGGSGGRHIDTVTVEVGGGVLVQGEEKLMEVGREGRVMPEVDGVVM